MVRRGMTTSWALTRSRPSPSPRSSMPAGRASEAVTSARFVTWLTPFGGRRSYGAGTLTWLEKESKWLWRNKLKNLENSATKRNESHSCPKPFKPLWSLASLPFEEAMQYDYREIPALAAYID